jgi:aspartate-semialdehyde dehydrogenase|tara:strand:+ start:1417 stop:2424 length:1008 start_codon:yes stop_codon:yes gene_type:complete
MNFAIIGATGNVGRKTIEILEKSNIQISNLFLVASEKSEGKKIKFKGKEIQIESLKTYDFSKAQITFFAAGGKIAEEWVPKASKKTVVIDNSKVFRMDKDVPLIVPEVNPNKLSMFKNKNIIANPNCSTIQMVVALKPLHENFNIKRVIVSTYQSVSGAGKAPMDELISQTKEYLEEKKINSKNFTKQIAFNLIPHIDEFKEEGYTREEWKMISETKKILDPKINLTATCVRVPVMVSHAESLNVEFEKSFDIKKVRDILDKADGCKVVDERKNGGYTTPVEAENKNFTFISRIRKDNSRDNALNMWVVSDNLLKGAALNTVQIAERLIKDFYGK